MLTDFCEVLKFPKIIIEVGVGDCRLLKLLAKQDSLVNKVVYVGIENNTELLETAKSQIDLPNIILLKGSFEDIIPLFRDGSIDKILMVLPDPTLIDYCYQQKWMPLYKIIRSKLKIEGSLIIVTDIIHDLFEPVSDELYQDHVAWLQATFQLLGFKVLDAMEGSPSEYSTHYLDLFKKDPERIRIVTLNLTKDSHLAKLC
jgi:hypothetical protein